MSNKNNSKIPEVKMTFGVEMMDIINKFPLTPEAALAEFIDNSIQSYVDKKKYLKRNHSKYILEMINSLEDDNVILSFNDASSPVIATEQSNPDLIYVLMPMRI